MGAINVLDQPAEFIVRNCFLVLLQYSPSRMVPENAEIVRGASAAGKDRQKDKKK